MIQHQSYDNFVGKQCPLCTTTKNSGKMHVPVTHYGKTDMTDMSIFVSTWKVFI